MVQQHRRPREDPSVVPNDDLVGEGAGVSGHVAANDVSTRSKFKHVLVEITPMPAPSARLRFTNLGTSAPRLELEDGTVYVGEFQDMFGSVLVFKETKLTTRVDDAEGCEGGTGMEIDAWGGGVGEEGLHGAMMARLEEAQAREEGGGGGGGGGQNVGATPESAAGTTQKNVRKPVLNVSTVTEMEGVANVKLVFTLKK